MHHALWLFFLPAGGYQCLAITAVLGHLSRGRHSRPQVDSSFQPGVSVLKPLHGLDPNTYDAFASHVKQRYPVFEILFGVSDENDPAAAQVRRLQAEFPDTSVQLVAGCADAANGKVGVLIELARHARHPIWVVNDSDIKVNPDYLAEVVAPLADSQIGVVTCPYRALAHNVPAAWESIGIATDFIPSALVAQLVGVREFGFGSTLAFRAADLDRVGGFKALSDYLADDYQLAKRITSLGKRALLSTYVVETSLADSTWTGIWRHQLRWARTIRLSKGRGHAGLPITHAGVWILIAIACGAWLPAVILIGTRMLSALITGWFVLRSRTSAAFFWLAPAWDLYAFAVWLLSYAGTEVRWRDRKLTIDSQGRIMR